MNYTTKPDAARATLAANDNNSSRLLDKRGLADFVGMSPRWIDGQLGKGLPHLKLGPRRVRFDAGEALDWLRGQYSTQRRGPVALRRPQVGGAA